MGNLGLAYDDLGDPRKAIEYHDQALKIARKIGDRRGEGAALGNLGSGLRLIWAIPRKAIEYHDQALKIRPQDRGQTGLKGACLGQPGLCLRRSGRSPQGYRVPRSGPENRPQDRGQTG